MSYKLQSGSWDELEQDAKQIRKAVFVIEQQIPEQEEWDAQDALSLHFVVYVPDQHLNLVQPIATARLLKNNSIGRVAVLKQYRGQGVGCLIMQKVIEQAKIEQREYVELSSQVHAVAFYESLGFIKEGEVYLDCGIPHIDMYMKIIQ